ncbi:DUF2726 domain-containing protein [Veillonella agrestimuris]|uniref:DUF2726 domain-containing protein n=1 Tax=Veillonella agrestimuris TaxID=2941340 RepID=UPI00203B8F8F|nr:DUF2726 domain-containing protein [Veillonella agrestimuris]
MTLTICILVIILIGVYLNLYITWRNNYQSNKIKTQSPHNQVLYNTSDNTSDSLAKCEISSKTENTNKSKKRIAKEKENHSPYKPIAEYAEYYEPWYIQTLSEKNVFNRLIRILSPYNVYIFPQVSFSCIVTGEGEGKEAYTFANFNRIAKKRVDYAIVNHYGKTLFIIELDGASHNPNAKELYTEDGFLQELKDQDRDEFWKICKIPSIRIPLAEIMDLEKSTINKKTDQLSPYIIDEKLFNQIKQNHNIFELLEEHRK